MLSHISDVSGLLKGRIINMHVSPNHRQLKTLFPTCVPVTHLLTVNK
jgi:hypothetical protein